MGAIAYIFYGILVKFKKILDVFPEVERDIDVRGGPIVSIPMDDGEKADLRILVVFENKIDKVVFGKVFCEAETMSYVEYKEIPIPEQAELDKIEKLFTERGLPKPEFQIVGSGPQF
ncbi:MAG: hypothetical protein GF311_01565 [Candidatus Lokiarchaeota archaeon]|nr:hypothetical protein [Candidatus Lokiarchaeota archaeon]